MSADNIIGLIAAIALSVYLILALVKPERF
ncbi:K(+)-transporting ATPase subunit F [Actinospica durhamensis]|uniref:K(+)-transporting ATPase subunit F n=1 Tax=Actinospica durhamensis TaxID=1508375 RepID=A0A941EI52_9ACTN|nr:K(+)-transporting ATPase subunit F [Actinospica durhamensis]MBR7833000.1 K(+)-transporting ATPase subunit F [Actinospica durhamensis]MBR7837775.1 K(+)-transporting ATPase subunit F [Actinospica durhamensis]